MAKNESTAINELIRITTTQQPLKPDPADDLMFRVPATASAPPPLPRHRSPSGTEQQGLPTVPPAAERHPSRPPGRAPAASTMQGLGPVVRAATAAPKAAPKVAPPAAVDDAWTDEETTAEPQRGKTTMPSSMPLAAPFEAPKAAAPRSTPAKGAPVPVPPRPPVPPAPPSLKATLPPAFAPAQPRSAVQPAFTVPAQARTPPRGTAVQAPLTLPMTASETLPMAASTTLPMPSAAAPVAPVEAPVTLDMTGEQAWFDQMRRSEADSPEEALIGTIQVQRRTNWKVVAGRLAGPMFVLMVAGVFVGGYFAFDGQGGKPRAAAAKGAVAVKGAAVAAAEPAAPAETPKSAVAASEPAVATAPVPAPPAAAAAPAAPAPAPEPAAPAAPAAPVAAPAAAPAPAPAPAPTPVPSKFVDVMIVSSPAGATVTLVDRGKTTFIGTTPISTALDPSRKYELVFSHPSKPAQIESIDPSATRRVEVKLGTASPAPRPAAKPAAVLAPKPAAAPAPAPAAAAEAPRAEKAVAETKPAAPAGEGTLMIASKPPCEIVIDGKPTGLVTPQRAIALPAGGHRITLVNAAENINKTIAVQITAGTPTKVIQDLMAK